MPSTSCCCTARATTRSCWNACAATPRPPKRLLHATTVYAEKCRFEATGPIELRWIPERACFGDPLPNPVGQPRQPCATTTANQGAATEGPDQLLAVGGKRAKHAYPRAEVDGRIGAPYRHTLSSRRQWAPEVKGPW